ncbi:ATP-grasp domain-containing protein [Sphingomonas sp. IC-11]|uniref:ATP-grasp domain-containing protein n=1 Tax=Sphingomonas sp. IC-11 TaxID=2898528 RepID=UPI001E3A43A6|nr:ATP-grasp domain-containing protein [Sphingomonas sp. IC-11]MCD2317023.1 ATP-grasp domain-containing protein [Sphingomonas sp. IC-11]
MMPLETCAHVTILLSSAGRRVALLEAFRSGARELGIELTVIATDMNPQWSAACRIADHAAVVPAAGDPRFVEETAALCEQYGVGLIVPTIDPELPVYAAALDVFERAGTRILADPDLIGLSSNKLDTARWLAAIGVPVPLTQAIEAVRCGMPMTWPAIVKPAYGSASRGVSVAHTLNDLPGAWSEPMVVQQQLIGEEWTVNAFVDSRGVLRTVVPHRRVAVRAGEVEKGVTQRVPAFRDVAEQIVSHLPSPAGPFCFQAIIEPDGTIGVFEINARFGGGYPLADRAGATFAKWLLAETAGLPVEAADDWIEGMTMLRYDAAVFGMPCA